MRLQADTVASGAEGTFDRAAVGGRRAGRAAGLRATAELLLTLTASDLRFRYGRGPWQVVRWLLDPVALVGVYLILITVVLNRPGEAPGLSLACAVIPFQLVILGVANAMGAVSVRAPIVTNMGFRRSLIPLSSVLTESVAFGASFLLIAVMMAVYGVAPSLALLWLPVVVVITFLLSAGFAYPASLFGLWYREAKPFGLSFMRILFFIGPGLVPLSTASPQAQEWLKLNPLTGLFETYRDIFLYGRAPEPWQLLYPLGVAVVLLLLVVPVYVRDQREFAKVIG